jgi:hypothetical protein
MNSFLSITFLFARGRTGLVEEGGKLVHFGNDGVVASRERRLELFVLGFHFTTFLKLLT